MTPAHTTNCPACGKRLKVRPELLKRAVRCPQCRQQFSVEAIHVGADTSVGAKTLEGLTLVAGAPSKKAFSLPQHVGRYQIQTLLGAGGFGRVYRAYDPQHDRSVALKVPLFDVSDKVRTQRFLEEARAAGRLQHASIVPTYDSGEIDGQLYIASAFIDGHPLSEIIRRETIGLRQAATWIRDLADALAYAHSKEIVHRDIKPHNVMIDAEKRPHLMDFGLAKRTDAESSLTTEGSLLGTPAYMSPEQAKCETDKIGPASDQYSLGVVLFELMTGRKPFEGEPLVVIMRISREDPPSPRSIREDIPRDIEAICLKAMNRDPDGRYPDCSAFSHDLSCWLEGSSTIARPLSSITLAVRWARRHAMVTGLMAVIFLLFGLLALTHWSKQTPQSPQSDEVAKQSEPTIPRPPITPTADDNISPESVRSTSAKIPLTASQPQSSGKPPKSAEQDAPHDWYGWPPDAPRPAIAPFDAEQAQQYQEEWAAYLNVPVEYENSIGMKFRLIPPGEFWMGSSSEEIEYAFRAAGGDRYWQDRILSEGPRHRVILTQPFYLGRHEVTQKQYEVVMNLNPSRFSDPAGKDSGSDSDATLLPVETISWNDTNRFCELLCQRESLQPHFVGADEFRTPQEDGNGYRLPTEAEWEFSCRAGTTTRFWCGEQDNALHEYAWQRSNSASRPHAVGGLKENPFGLHDVAGNIWEFVYDYWDPFFYGKYQEQPAINPIAKSSLQSHTLSYRVLRGGNWAGQSLLCRSADRGTHDPTSRHYDVGFRVALTTNGVKSRLDFDLNTPSVPVDQGKSAESLPIAEQEHAPLEKSDWDPEFDLKISGLRGEQDETIAKLSVAQQKEKFTEQMREVNPRFVMKTVTVVEEQGEIVEISFSGIGVVDLTPLQTFSRLKRLAIREASQLRDLAPLRDLKLTKLVIHGASRLKDLSPLEELGLSHLEIERASQVSDLSPLQGLKLKTVNLGYTGISNLSALCGMPLETLDISYTEVRSLEHLRDMPLKSLRLNGCKIKSLEPLAGLRLETFVFTHPYKGINPSAKGDPIYDPKLFNIHLNVLKGMPLRYVDLSGCAITDLSPLEGAPIEFLNIDGNRIMDLSCLSRSPIKTLRISATDVTDLTPLKDMPISELWCSNTKITSLEPLRGKQLTLIDIRETKITTIGVLKEMSLKHVFVSFNNKRSIGSRQSQHEIDTLGAIPSLESINGMSVEEFFKTGTKRAKP